MPKKATVKYRSLRSNLVHLPLSLYASLVQQQARPQSLILHLSPLASSGSRAQAAYLGWSGLASASSLASGVGGEETVEVDPEVGMGLGWGEGMVVDISVIHNPTRARSVSVTPLTSDDWEILEQHASFLEENLLSQLRTAQKGRVIDAWVNRTKIRLRVDDTDPKTSETSVVLLHNGTEVYVAPRPRHAANTPSEQKTISSTSSPGAGPSGAHQQTPSLQGNGKGKGKEKSVELRMIPQDVASAWGRPGMEEGVTLGSLERVIFCSDETRRRVRRKLGVGVDGAGPIYVSLTIGERAGEQGEAKEENEKPLDPKDETDGEMQAWLFVWDEMPDGHLVLAGKGYKEWSRWSKVRIRSATPPKGRLKGNTSSQPDSNLPLAPQKPPLPGTAPILEEALSYLRRAALSTTPRPLLLTGGKGSGKTSLIKQLGRKLELERDVLAEPIYEDVGRLDGDVRLKEIKAKMVDWMEQANERSPSLLILDGLDTLLAPENELNASANPLILAEHFARLFSPASLPPGLLVVATASSISSLHPLLNTKHVFGETLRIPVLTKETRREILAGYVAERQTGLEGLSSLSIHGHDEELDFVTLSSNTEGYSAADLSDLTDGAMQQAVIRCTKSSEHVSITMGDFDEAQKAFTPVSLRGVTLQKSEVAWSDIGGLTEPRRVLRETLEWPTRYAQIFASCPLRLRSGLLLYGYPGCGKTLLASAVAKECGLNFISVKGPEILNKYIGASEKAVRDLFERASAAKPCVLFFDEFDSIAPKRGHDSTGVTDRVVNQMLTEMDGAQGLEGVYVLAATSRPDLIDSALLRPGRLDKAIICDMPRQEERLDILRAVSRKLSFGSSVDWEQLSIETDGFSGADLQALVYNAHLEVVHSSITAAMEQTSARDGITGNGEGKGKGKGKGKSKVESNGVKPNRERYKQVNPVEETSVSDAVRTAFNERIDTMLANDAVSSAPVEAKKAVERPKPVIEQHHLLRSLSETRPSVAPADRAKLQKIYASFVSDRDGKVANGEMGRETGTRASLM